MIKNYMEKMKAKGWNFQTFSAGVDTDAKPEEKLMPTGIKKEDDDNTIQDNKEHLYPLGVGPNQPQTNQDEPEAETEQLLPAGVNQ